MGLRDLLCELTVNYAVIKKLKDDTSRIEAKINKECPHKIGDVVSIPSTGRPGMKMCVTSVQYFVTNGAWFITGRKMRKDGTPGVQKFGFYVPIPELS